MTTQNPKMYSRLSNPAKTVIESNSILTYCFLQERLVVRQSVNVQFQRQGPYFSHSLCMKSLLLKTDLKTEEELLARTKFDINEVDVSGLYAAIDGIKLEDLDSTE